jgi:predicted dithiol-disulfide oxidoreductase (DUF899 family)
MFGPSYAGACPGCSNLADQLDGGLIHLNHRDVTFLCFSRAPLEKLQGYKRRMGWQFPWVSTYGSDFPFDFELASSMSETSGSTSPAPRASYAARIASIATASVYARVWLTSRISSTPPIRRSRAGDPLVAARGRT